MVPPSPTVPEHRAPKDRCQGAFLLKRLAEMSTGCDGCLAWLRAVLGSPPTEPAPRSTVPPLVFGFLSDPGEELHWCPTQSKRPGASGSTWARWEQWWGTESSRGPSPLMMGQVLQCASDARPGPHDRGLVGAMPDTSWGGAGKPEPVATARPGPAQHVSPSWALGLAERKEGDTTPRDHRLANPGKSHVAASDGRLAEGSHMVSGNGRE